MRTHAVAVLTLVLLLVGSTVGSANADTTVLNDPAGDMWRTDFEGRTEPAPHRSVGDVRRAAFRHGKVNIVIRMGYVDLRRAGAYTLYGARLQNGSRTRYREVQVEAGPGAWQGTVKVFDLRGDRVPCKPTHRIDYDENTVVLAVPRSCLGTPAVVRASASSSWTHRGQQVFLLDNPHNERAGATSWTSWLRSS